MLADTYCVTFSGKIIEDADLPQVQVTMAKLFRLDRSRPEHREKLKRMFSGRKIIIKNDMSREQAEKYQHAITQVGAISHIEPSHFKEQRNNQRRKLRDRRSIQRTSSILPDRRQTLGRRQSDLHDAA